jgi:catechol 2,3-dioxygenase-like lactoylglutathione lyase family enzyme
MMKMSKLYETHFYTRDLERSIEFYQSLDLQLAYAFRDRGAAFFWLGDPAAKEQMLGIWEVPEEKFVASHFALSVSLEQLMEIP